MQDATPLLFDDLFHKSTFVTFEEKDTSSDGGGILLEAISKKMHLLDVFTEAIEDRRQAGKVDHTVEELVRQRLFAIGCGYPDANDVERLQDDPIIRLLAGLRPEDAERRPWVPSQRSPGSRMLSIWIRPSRLAAAFPSRW